MHLVIIRQSNQPLSQFSGSFNAFKSIWSMFPCNVFLIEARIFKWTIRSWHGIQSTTMGKIMCYTG